MLTSIPEQNEGDELTWKSSDDDFFAWMSVDGGSDVNTCPFLPYVGVQEDITKPRLNDVQGGKLKVGNWYQVGMYFESSGGEYYYYEDSFIESSTKKWLISEGELNMKGFRKTTQGSEGVLHIPGGEACIPIKMIGRSWYVKVWLVNPWQKAKEVTVGAVDDLGLEIQHPNAASSGNPHPSDVVGEGPPAVATPSPDVVEAPGHGMVEHVPP